MLVFRKILRTYLMDDPLLISYLLANNNYLNQTCTNANYFIMVALHFSEEIKMFVLLFFAINFEQTFAKWKIFLTQHNKPHFKSILLLDS